MKKHQNNVGLMRLVLATLVILGHAPEIVDGDRHREPVNMVFHSSSLGTLAVASFFLLSGYLIAKSMIRTESLGYYLERRALRIYPAFLIASLICVFILCPLVGGNPWSNMGVTLGRMAFLMDPMNYSGQLQGLPVPALNGSMWTIAYEFRCYLLVGVLGVVGLLRKSWTIMILTIFVVIAAFALTFPSISEPVDSLVLRHRGAAWFVGVPSWTMQLTAPFLMGLCFYLWRDSIFPYLSGRVALCATAIAAVGMYGHNHLVLLAFSTFGAVALFWFAFKADLRGVQKINDKWDISYGTYLYGWPIAIFIFWLDRDLSPWLLAALTLPVALVAGALSWFGVEKWTKDFRRSRSTASLG